MKQEYRHMIEQIKFTDEEKERIMKNIENNNVRHGRKPLLAVSIAACVCIALMGTAFAVAVGFGIFTWDNGDGTVTWEAREKLFPYDSVTDEARQNFESTDPENKIIGEVMGSWQEIQKRTGVDLIDSALLDGAEPANYRVRQCYTVTYFPESLNINRSHIIDGVTVELIANVRMEGYKGTDGEVYATEHTFDKTNLGKTYTLTDGTVVYYNINEYMAGSKVTEFRANFICGGVEYSLSTTDAQRDKIHSEMLVKRENLEQAGKEIDYDELNAPLRQFQVDPNTDYEGVFFRVLDSFTLE